MLSILFALSSLAQAGEIFYLDYADGNFRAMEMRTQQSRRIGYPPTVGGPYEMGMAYDPTSRSLWVYGPANGRGSPIMSRFNIDTLVVDVATQPSTQDSNALAFDPTIGAEVFRVADAWFYNYPATGIFSAPACIEAADWSDLCDCTVAITCANEVFAIYPATNTFVPIGSVPWGPGFELAYDADLRIYWRVDALGHLYGLDPITFQTIADVDATPGYAAIDGGAGSIDNVAPQTPALLVTGTCPGLVYVTVADATPNEHVQIASATRLGNRPVRAGPCRGTNGGLANPVLRLDLVANTYGIASTTLQATAPFCDALHLQALDVASCQATDVATVPAAVP